MLKFSIVVMAEIRPALDYVETFEDRELLTKYGSETIKASLESVMIRPKDYILIGGANLVLRGILVSTPDIDLLVSDTGFSILAQQPGAKLKDPPVRAQLEGAKNRAVSLRSSKTGMPLSATPRMGNGYYPIGFNSHKSRTELIRGIPCLLLEHVIGSKQALGREKDIDHLKRIAISIGRTITLPEGLSPYPGDS